jgi:hypothetical protein
MAQKITDEHQRTKKGLADMTGQLALVEAENERLRDQLDTIRKAISILQAA